ncbi:MAG: hypothetical protein RIS36_1459 [Pseudomonadota bacterium]
MTCDIPATEYGRLSMPRGASRTRSLITRRAINDSTKPPKYGRKRPSGYSDILQPCEVGIDLGIIDRAGDNQRNLNLPDRPEERSEGGDRSRERS